MNIKSLLLGSAAALVAVSGARAADAIIAAEPEPVEYVRVCDAFGTGYFYIPGTETCLRIHGYVRYDIGAGELFAVTADKNAGTSETYFKRARASFRVSTASETEMGTLRTYVETRWQFDTNDTAAGYTNDGEFSINFAWIQLGGLRIGKDESFFTTWTGYAGSVINDGNYGPFDTNLISYTYNGGAFRAGLALEQGDDNNGTAAGWGIDDYMPHVVGGVGYNAGMFDVSAVLGYDTRDNLPGVIRGGWTAKLRADVTFNDAFSAFAMLMYGENESAYTTWANGLRTDETFSVIGGATFKASDRLNFNAQVQWIDSNVAVNSDAWSVVGNLNYTVVPGLVVTPELVYADSGVRGTDGQFGGYFRVQRSF
ncbi:MAG: porin [Hoeflea sp.]|nr:porin [Hoeflea sp.]